MRPWLRWRTALLVSLCLLACSTAGPADRPPQPEPDLRVEAVEVIPRAVSLDAASAAADKLPRLKSLLVDRRDELILERYFNGAGANRPANVKSVSKTVISALVGIAIDRGLLPGVDAPIGPYFPKLLAGDDDAPKRDITIQDLLTMRSGLESTSSRNYGAWVQSSNWVRHALGRQLISVPGDGMNYSTGNTHLLSAILTKTSGMSTWEFARDVLGKPLGFELARWQQDPQGIYFGGNNMSLTPRQMMAFGKLYLAGGQTNGGQIVSPDWVTESFVPRTRSRRSHRLYGYGWWIRDLAGVRTYYAWGYGGQFIFVIPDLQTVVVATSSENPGGQRHGHREELYDLVADHIITPIRDSELPHQGTIPLAARANERSQSIR